MENDFSIKNTPTWNYAKDIQEICQPLKKFKINYFDYCVFYPDDSGIILTTDQNWVEHYFKNKFHIGATIHHEGIHLWTSYIEDKVILDARNGFGKDYGLSVFKKHENCVEYFDIATHENNHGIVDFYFNHLDLLEQFLNYFKYKAAPIIKKANKQRLIIPQQMKGTPQNEFDIRKQNFLEEIQVNKVFLSSEINNLYLTKREIETIKIYLKGYSAKEIAKQMSLSPRTIEYHLANIKHKFNAPNKAILFEKMTSFNLI